MGGCYIMKNFYERYKHAIPLMVYAVIYCVWFAWLEKKVINPPFIIHMKIDDRIPFLEVFVIPMFPRQCFTAFSKINRNTSTPVCFFLPA